MKLRYLIFIPLLLCLVGWGPYSYFEAYMQIPGAQQLDKEIRQLTGQTENLNPKVLKLSLAAYKKAKQKNIVHKEVITIIDYSLSSVQPRLWVIDLKKHKVLLHTLAAHGKNSGEAYTTSFSNKPKSHKSSLGVFITDEVYTGNHGSSLRIQGLEPGINDNVYRRAVVFHGAHYVNKSITKEKGRLGRSHGCIAVSQETIKPLIHAIKDKTLVVAYYPDPHWLKTSRFLTGI